MAKKYDVVVVGAGIGGLTVAALLSARGMNVCVLERQSQVGGCAGRVEFSGYEFEPGMGIYTSFGQGEIHERIFAELPVATPQTSLVSRPYVVRLADGTDVRLIHGDDFFDELSRAFPECADQAIGFYRKPAAETLAKTSGRFQSFIETQVRGFVHSSIEQSSVVAVAPALARARGPLYEIHGGTAMLAERLAESITHSGSTVRLNTPVLRLAYDSSGAAKGVDLLNGEQVFAQHVVSNLTIWDTFGKLVGLNRTPPEIKKQLNALHGTGAYVVYATIEASAIARLPSERLLVANPSDVDSTAGAENAFTEFTLAISHGTATLKSATDVNDWFTYHASEEDFEESDQAALENFWTGLHAAVPELGGDIEVVETANPRSFYDQTRRKLGMILGLAPLPDQHIPAPTAIVPNLHLVGDTVAPAADLASVAETALTLANRLTKSK